MKIAVYLPNLIKNSGGAEVYALYMSKVLSENHEIIIIASKGKKQATPDAGAIYHKYGLIEMNTCFVNSSFDSGHNNMFMEFCKERFMNYKVNRLLKKIDPDLFINATQAKLICKACSKSIHIVHFPPKRYRFGILSKLDQRYIHSYNLLISNSNFGKYYLKKMYGRNSVVLYPPITFEPIDRVEMNSKEKIILAVDRIVPDKKILEMIEAYKKLVSCIDEEYKFVIVGNRDSNEVDYYHKVLQASKDYNIEIHCDVSYEDLLKWYKCSSFFWHAKGYRVTDDPEKMEHFGMTTVEAMVNACIPIVINKAGQKEIMQDGLKELTWDELDQLVDITKSLVKDEKKVQALRNTVVIKAQKYLYPVFCNRVKKIMSLF